MGEVTVAGAPRESDPGTDPSGRPAPDPAADGGEGAGAGTGAGPGRRSPRRIDWRAVTGLVAFAYVVWASVDLLVLARSGPVFTDLHRHYGNLGVRVVFAGVVVALLHHGLDGMRVALEDLVPATRRADRWLRALTRFGVPAVGIPAALVLVWPAVRGWFA